MTLVLGQKFFQGIVIVADSRASRIINGRVVPWKDNVQKIFRISDHVFIAFSGDIEFASLILYFLLKEVARRPMLGNLNVFCQKTPKLIRYAYQQALREFRNDARPVSFMFGGVDFKRPTLVKEKNGSYNYISIFDKKLLLFTCPGFESNEAQNWQNPFLIMGSGSSALSGNEENFKKLQFDLRADLPLSFQAFLIQDSLQQKVKELRIDSVGGMFQIVTIDNTGSGFLEYKARSSENHSEDLDIELIIRENRMIQRNLKTGSEMPLLYPPEILQLKDFSRELFNALNR